MRGVKGFLRARRLSAEGIIKEIKLDQFRVVGAYTVYLMAHRTGHYAKADLSPSLCHNATHSQQIKALALVDACSPPASLQVGAANEPPTIAPAWASSSQS